MKSVNLLKTLFEDMPPITRKFNNHQSIVLDLLSPLLDILQPTLRPVSTFEFRSFSFFFSVTVTVSH